MTGAASRRRSRVRRVSRPRRCSWRCARASLACTRTGTCRTLQRRVKAWRAAHGTEKDLFFPQEHLPGEAAQTDFTWVTELGITIGGEAYPPAVRTATRPPVRTFQTAASSTALAPLRRTATHGSPFQGGPSREQRHAGWRYAQPGVFAARVSTGGPRSASQASPGGGIGNVSLQQVQMSHDLSL